MAKVLGLGGVFFKSRDKKSLGDWYKKWLGLPVEHPWGAVLKHDQLPDKGYSVWSPFESDTDYFAPSEQPFMINLIVDDLDGVLAQLTDSGAKIMPDREEGEFGRFGWIIDPEGNKVELWQPPA